MWPDQEGTQELLREAQAGRPEAVERLMTRHREGLLRMIRWRMDHALARRVDASDIVQDVLLEASRRLADYLADPRLPFHLWLRQMARDRLIDAHRRHRLAERRSVDREQPLVQPGGGDQSSVDWAGAVADPQITPATAALRGELAARFRAALDQMPPDDREVLILRHCEHLSNQEVAQALELTPAAAGMRYLRALRRLRTVLGAEADGLASAEL